LKDLTLAADGIFSADCSVQRLNQTFGTDEHLFKVVPRQYYDAAEELKKSSSANRIDEQQEKLLVESYNNEIKINQLRLEKKMHAQTSVVYGDTVMLQHVKSGRWLTVVTTKFAKVQNHHRRVKLTNHPSTSCWFSMLAHHKINQRGSIIHYNSSVKLSSPKLSSHFLHVAEQKNIHLTSRNIFLDQNNIDSFEVNCAGYIDGSVFVVHGVHVAKTSHSLLWTKKLIQIEHIETEEYLCCAAPPIHRINGGNGGEGTGGNEIGNEERMIASSHNAILQTTTKNKKRWPSSTMWTLSNTNENNKHIKTDGTIYWNIPIVLSNHTTSSSIIVRLVKTHTTNNGSGSSGTGGDGGGSSSGTNDKRERIHANARFYVQEVNSGKYLSQHPQQQQHQLEYYRHGPSKPTIWNQEATPADAFTATMVDTVSMYDFEYCISASKHLEQVAVMLDSNSSSTGEIDINSGSGGDGGGRGNGGATDSCGDSSGNESTSEDSNDEGNNGEDNNRGGVDNNGGDNKGGSSKTSTTTSVLPFIVVHETTEILKKLTSYCYGLSDSQEKEMEIATEDQDKNTMKESNKNASSSSSSNIMSEIGMNSGNKDRQRCLREFHILDHLVVILKKMTSVNNQNEYREQNLAKKLYSLLQALTVELPENQMHAAASLPLFLTHITYQVGAEEAITKILENNVELLEGELGHHALKVFLEHVKRKGISSPVLNFLAEVCTSKNKFKEEDVLEFNQRRICRDVFSTYSFDNVFLKVLIGKQIDQIKQTQVKQNTPWLTRRTQALHAEIRSTTGTTDTGPVASNDTDVVLGQELVINGLSNVIVCLPGNNGGTQYSLGTLPLEWMKLLEAQLRLYAALCKGRNYTAILALQKKYSYELCITVLQSSSFNSGVRGAMALLLSSLWVNRWPATTWVLERPVHTADSLRGSNNTNVIGGGRNGKDKTNHFSLLKDIVWNYLNSGGGAMVYTECGENQCLSDVVTLFRSLVRNGQYINLQELDVVSTMLVQMLNEKYDRLDLSSDSYTSQVYLCKGSDMEMFASAPNGTNIEKFRPGWCCLLPDNTLRWWWYDVVTGRQSTKCIVIRYSDIKTIEAKSTTIVQMKRMTSKNEVVSTLFKASSPEVSSKWLNSLQCLLLKSKYIQKRPKRARSLLEHTKTIKNLTVVQPVAKAGGNPKEGGLPVKLQDVEHPHRQNSYKNISNSIMQQNTAVKINVSKCSHAFSSAKKNMCDTLSDVSIVWQNHRLTLIHRRMMEQVECSNSTSDLIRVGVVAGGAAGDGDADESQRTLSKTDIFTRKNCLKIVDDVLAMTPQLNLRAITGEYDSTNSNDYSFPQMLFELCSSEHTDLVASSFRLLINSYLQRYDLIRACRTTQLIISKSVGLLLEKGRARSIQIQRLTETFEVWGDDANRDTTATVEYGMILESLTFLNDMLCEVKSQKEEKREGNQNCTNRVNTDAADLVSGLHLTSLTKRLIELIRIPLDFICNDLNESLQKAIMLMDTMCKMHTIVGRYLFQHVQTLLLLIEDDDGQSGSKEIQEKKQQETLTLSNLRLKIAMYQLISSIIDGNDSENMNPTKEIIANHVSSKLKNLNPLELQTSLVQVMKSMLQTSCTDDDTRRLVWQGISAEITNISSLASELVVAQSTFWKERFLF